MGVIYVYGKKLHELQSSKERFLDIIGNIFGLPSYNMHFTWNKTSILILKLKISSVIISRTRSMRIE